MENFLIVSAENYIEFDTLSECLKKIVTKLNLNYHFPPNDKDGYYMDIYENNFGDISWLRFIPSEKFEDQKKRVNYLPVNRYGVIFSITTNVSPDNDDESITVPIIREFLKEYPDVFIYNEGHFPEGVYTKADFDGFTSNSFNENLKKPPKKVII